MALGKHLVQAEPIVYVLQRLTSKADNNKNDSFLKTRLSVLGYI